MGVCIYVCGVCACMCGCVGLYVCVCVCMWGEGVVGMCMGVCGGGAFVSVLNQFS